MITECVSGLSTYTQTQTISLITKRFFRSFLSVLFVPKTWEILPSFQSKYFQELKLTKTFSDTSMSRRSWRKRVSKVGAVIFVNAMLRGRWFTQMSNSSKTTGQFIRYRGDAYLFYHSKKGVFIKKNEYGIIRRMSKGTCWRETKHVLNK